MIHLGRVCRTQCGARRTSIRLLNGRSFHGIIPGNACLSLEEHWLRDALARQLGGITEAFLGVGGRADVITPDRVFEVKAASSWQSGFRQLLAYSALCGCRPGLALFGLTSSSQIRLIFETLQHVELSGLSLPGAPELWWWAGTRWEHVSTPADCIDMPVGTKFGSCGYCGALVVWPGDGIPDKAALDLRGTRTRGVHHCEELCMAAHSGRKDCLIQTIAALDRATVVADQRDEYR